MKPLSTTIFFAMASALFFSACQSPTTTGYSVRAAETGGDSLDTCLRVDNGTLANTLRVASLHTASSERDGRMIVQASILNDSRRDHACQYKFRFFDADDLEIESRRPWQSVVFHGGEEVRLQATAPAPGAVAFQIHVRPLPATRKY